MDGLFLILDPKHSLVEKTKIVNKDLPLAWTISVISMKDKIVKLAQETVDLMLLLVKVKELMLDGY